MKILVLARKINPDETSEGICTSKFLRLLKHLGHEVLCLTSDEAYSNKGQEFSLPWLDDIIIRHINLTLCAGYWNSSFKYLEKLSAERPLLKALSNKVGAVCSYATGFNPLTWQRISAWKAAIDEVIGGFSPDVVFVRGAGGAFETHIAMLGNKHCIPWIANYHDPFPISLYPEPYRVVTPLLSHQQEAVHHRILAQAYALTFPSQRLLDWVLTGKAKGYRSKAFIIPHIASVLSPNSSISPGNPYKQSQGNLFQLIHTGTLLGPRDPQALLASFQDFIAQDSERRQKARLILVGGVNRNHRIREIGASLLASGNLILVDHRVSYQQALSLTKQATATIVLEANSMISPFFPAKLADFIWLRKPILALSPLSSVSADLLGSAYPLLARLTDTSSILKALNLLWNAWKTDNTDVFVPSGSVRESLSEESVGKKIDHLFISVMKHSSTN